MSEAEFISLKDNLQEHGQTYPIYTLDGMILDGGNRYRALCELGIEPVLTEYTGSNPAQFILSSNLHRRHLTQGQSAAIVSASQSWIKTQTDTELRNTAQLDSATSRAKQSGVGQRTQQLADKLVKEAPEELVKEVLDGKKSLNKAIKEITPPKPATSKTKPVPVVASENQDNQLNTTIDEQQIAIKVLEADSNPTLNAFDSDDKISVSNEEVIRLTELNRILNERMIELTREKEEALNNANHWKEQFLKLEEQLNRKAN
jgi:hypothetical protein